MNNYILIMTLGIKCLFISEYLATKVIISIVIVIAYISTNYIEAYVQIHSNSAKRLVCLRIIIVLIISYMNKSIPMNMMLWCMYNQFHTVHWKLKQYHISLYQIILIHIKPYMVIYVAIFYIDIIRSHH